MNIEVIRSQFPILYQILGEEWLQRNGWVEEFINRRIPWYQLLENDLTILNNHVSFDKLKSCYRDSLRDRPQIQKTIFEIHGSALLAKTAVNVDLHVPKGNGSVKNFDISVVIKGHQLNAESKTRKDEFPFNLPSESPDLTGVKYYGGSRTTVDKHDADELGINVTPATIKTPESTVIRQILLDGLQQLPESGCNMIIFGQIEGNRENVMDALWGTPILEFCRGSPDSEWKRIPTGAFDAGKAGESFRSLSCVLWISLNLDHDYINNVDIIRRDYTIFPNPNALNPIHDDVVNVIVDLIEQMRIPTGKKD